MRLLQLSPPEQHIEILTRTSRWSHGGQLSLFASCKRLKQQCDVANRLCLKVDFSLLYQAIHYIEKGLVVGGSSVAALHEKKRNSLTIFFHLALIGTEIKWLELFKKKAEL